MRYRPGSLVILPMAVLLFSCGNGTRENEENGETGTNEMPVYEQDFEKPGALDDFFLPEPGDWQIGCDSSGNHFLEAKGPGSYRPPYRSPFLIAIIDSVYAEDFVLEADLMQKTIEHDCTGQNCVFCMHRDMCVFWAYRDSSHYYYAHIAKGGDDVSHQVHIVNDAARTSVLSSRNSGVDWGENQWKHVKVVRSGSLLQVFFEDMENPVLESRDTTFTGGRLGFGSFDEFGLVDNIKVYLK